MKSKMIGAMVVIGAFLGVACPEPPANLWDLVQAQYQNLRSFSAEILTTFEPAQTISETFVFCFPFVRRSLKEFKPKGTVSETYEILRIENIQTGQAWILYNHGAWEEIIDQSLAGRHQVWLECLGVKELVVEEINVAELEGKQFWRVKGRVVQGFALIEAHVWVDCQSLFITRVDLKTEHFTFIKTITNFDPDAKVDPELFAPPKELIAQKSVVVPKGRIILSRVWDKLKTLDSFIVRKHVQHKRAYDKMVVYRYPYLREETRRLDPWGVPAEDVFSLTITDFSSGIFYERDPMTETWTKEEFKGLHLSPESAFYAAMGAAFSFPFVVTAGMHVDALFWPFPISSPPVAVEEKTWRDRKVWRIVGRKVVLEAPQPEWWVDQETLAIVKYVEPIFICDGEECRWEKKEGVVISFEVNPEIPAELLALPAQARERRVIEALERPELKEEDYGSRVTDHGSGELAPPLNWEPFSFARLEEAKAQGKGVVLFFTADWCEACHRLERGPLRDPKVQELLSPFVLLKVDLTKREGEARKAADIFRVRGLPTLVFLNPEGKELGRITGYIQFFRTMIERIVGEGGK